MEITTLNVIAVSILSVMMAHWYEPIQYYKQKAIELSSPTKLYTLLNKALNCPKCLGFIVGIICFQSILVGAIVSFTSYVISFTIDVVTDWYED